MADQSDDDFIDLDLLFGEASDEAMGVATPAPEVATLAPEESIEHVLDSAFTGSGLALPDHEDTLDDFMSEVQQQSNVPRISKPWMKHHKFVRVTSAEEVESIVDEALANGKCSLDLETEGFDNRINYDAEGRPSTVHKIVGFCISVGDAKTGYYIPIRHRPEFGCDDLNVKPVERVEAAIRRLCIASQPTPKPGQADPLGYKEFETPPKVVIDFWNAKFDQEFLFPITGIDFWHPDSFQDGLLACYVLYSDDKHLGLKDKSKEKLRDPDGNPYEMIELKELFIRGRTIQFYALAPDEEGVLNYACSDAVCTRLLGDHPDILLKVLSKKEWAGTYRLEKMVAQVIRSMERCRVRVDRSRIERMLIANEALRSALREKIVELARSKGFYDFEPNSPKQLGEFLFGERGLNLEPKPAKNEKSQQYKTDAETLETMVKEQANAPVILQWVVNLREYEKSQGTYLVNLFKNPDKNDELRFDFKQTGTQTGRFTAPGREVDHGFSGVPIHGMPKTADFRECFVARPGYTMIKSDYAGQELRIAANVSNESVWIDEFLKGSGDLHTITARAFFGKHEVTKDERSKGKCVHPDTLIPTPTGLMPIGRLGAFPEEADTFTAFGEIPLWGGVRVEALYNGGVKPLVHVVGSGGIVTCTEVHRFKLRDGSLAKAEELQPGDLLFQAPQPNFDQSLPYQDLDISLWEGIPQSRYVLHHDLAYFAGVYVGDGTGNASMARLCHGAPDKIDYYGNPYEDWVRVLEKACSRCGFTSTRKKDYSLYLGSRVFIRLLRELGIQRKREKNLRVPWWVLAAGKESILHYLGGLFDTDGTVGENNHNLDWTTKDFILAGQVACALRSCGLDFNVELSFNKTYGRYYARLRLSVAASWHMRHYMRHEGKISRLREPRQQGQAKDRFEVLRVLPAGEGPCLDITVGDSDHLYLANGYLTHNTANFALIYGGGPAAIIRATGCDKMEAHRRKASFDKAVPTFAKWVKGQHAKVKKDLGIWNPFGRWIAIPDANVKDGDITSRGMRVTPQDANGIRAACERHACNYPIQSAGADVMKIALVLLYREFYKRGWLRNCGDDSVRMLLTVHDEIVFEIRHDRVPEVLSVIIDRMAAPGKIPQNPPWKVPLIVEPLIGSSWGGEYDYGMLTHGKAEPPKPDEKLKPYEIRVGDRIYHRVPPWLEGIFRPGYILPPSDAGSAPAPAAPPDLPPAPAPASPPDTGAAPVENPAEAVPNPELEPDESFGGPPTEATPKSAPPESAPSEKTGSVKEQIVSFRLREGNLSVQTAWTFRKVFAGFVDTEKGDVLIRVLDPWQTIALIDPANPKTRIRVRKDSLRKILEELCERNLTDGHFDFSDS